MLLVINLNFFFISCYQGNGNQWRRNQISVQGLISSIYKSNSPFSLIFWNSFDTVFFTFNSKLVGITDVISPEGVDMCAEAFGKLKVQCTGSWVMLIHELDHESKLKLIFCHNGNYKWRYILKHDNYRLCYSLNMPT